MGGAGTVYTTKGFELKKVSNYSVPGATLTTALGNQRRVHRSGLLFFGYV